MKEETKTNVLKAALIFLTIVAILFTWFYFAIWRIPVDEELLKIYKAGINKMVKRGESIPDSDNGRVDFENAVKKLPSLQGLSLTKYNDLVRRGIREEDRDTFRELSKKLAPALEDVDRGLNKKTVYIVPKYRAASKSILGIYFKLANFSRYMDFVGAYDVFEGDYSLAAKHFISEVWLGTGMGKGGLFVKGFVGLEIIGHGLDSLIKLMNNNSLKPETYRYIITQLARCDDNMFTYGELLDGEYLWMEYSIEVNKNNGKSLYESFNWKKPASIGGKLLMLLPKSIVLEREKKIYQNWYISQRQAMKKPYPKDVAIMEGYKFPLASLYNGIAYNLKNFIRLYKRTVWTRSKLRGAIILAALNAYKSDKGAYPDNLVKLVPDYLEKIPEDPAARGIGFIYKKEAKDILFYSIGIDGKDDKAKIESKEYDVPGDIIFLTPEIITNKNRQKSR